MLIPIPVDRNSFKIGLHALDKFDTFMLWTIVISICLSFPALIGVFVCLALDAIIMDIFFIIFIIGVCIAMGLTLILLFKLGVCAMVELIKDMFEHKKRDK